MFSFTSLQEALPKMRDIPYCYQQEQGLAYAHTVFVSQRDVPCIAATNVPSTPTIPTMHCQRVLGQPEGIEGPSIPSGITVIYSN